MQITAGLGRLEDYDRLAAAGADELFAGFVPLDWLERYGNFTPLNRREVLLHDIQFCSLGEMRLLAQRIAATGVPVALTFNAPCYRPDQYPQIGGMLSDLYDLGFDSWILADPGLMLWLRAHDVPGRVLLSGEAGCFNPDALRFFARLGIRRCIFPRKISPEEMAACIAALPGLEYEAFALNELCHYSGAFCASLHCDELEALCRVPYRPVGPDCGGYEAPDPGNPADFGSSGCGLCALPALRRAGITHLKLVGRGGHAGCLERDIRTLKRALELENPTPEDLKRLLPDGRCSNRCYYPPSFP